MIEEKVKNLASLFATEIIEVRRYLHQNPELSFEEEQTANYISQKLTEYGIEHVKNVAKTGIVGLIHGKNPDSKVIALRADMDALPIIEENDVEYKSCNNGVMHACGHDAHMASLLGAARILNEMKDDFTGTIKLFFQPSEESFPGGASVMINEGVLLNPVVDEVFGQHVLPELEVGKVGMRSGKYMASTDEVYLTVKGRGGHAATPDLNVDPVVIAAHIIIALQQLVSRMASPYIPTVLSFGKVIAAGRTNIIPNEVKLDGTLRTFDEDWRARAHNQITTMAQNVAKSMGGTCEVFIDKGYPFLVNDEQLTGKVYAWAEQYLGTDNVVPLEMRMTAEDFAYFAQKVPSCFYRLGTRNESLGITSNLHTPTFEIDESALSTGMGLMAYLAIQTLANE